MEDLDFVIDTTATSDKDSLKTFHNPFPLFVESKFKLETDQDSENSEKSENNVEEGSDEYFGLPQPSIRIKDALKKCPIKTEYFTKEEKLELNSSGNKITDKLFNALNNYLNELRPKTYSFVTDGIETKKDISKLGLSDGQLKKYNRKQREKTKGANWFNMKAPEITEELKNDIEILQMRSALDPKHFYKRNEMKTIPKYFEVGQVIESPVEYHNSKNTRKTKRSLVDELLEDANFQKFNKRKYQETLEQKKKTGYNKAMKKMRKLKKKKT
ncbi:CLUMA_CG015410, isoform A [Clunio marinus]|uniref:CLUMA_CG015410, isoform A n=1 Tax=Clunio marinus TaxID=568069 RepID=A0A1J1IPV4_9DIPT|nr:CLUMA_CG015410, isoform A [Clunio marinus]